MLVGIVGRPNSGKSTFFKAATLMDILIASYPFATIKANHAMAYVKIKDLAAEFGKVSNPREGYVKQGWRFVPFELMDVAGLVEGASEGKGLGNEFLNDLSAADAFIHVVDMSGEFDGAGKPVPDGNYDPSLDIKIIERELDLWYVGILKKVWKLFARMLEMQHSNFAEAVAKQFSGLKVSAEDVKHVVLKSNVNPEHPSKWTEEEIFKFAQMLRRYTKPMIIAANKVDRPNGRKNYEKVKSEFEIESKISRTLFSFKLSNCKTLSTRAFIVTGPPESLKYTVSFSLILSSNTFFSRIKRPFDSLKFLFFTCKSSMVTGWRYSRWYYYTNSISF